MMQFKGVVVTGRRLGHELGFPTANIELQGLDAVECGVYQACVVLADGSRYLAVANLGHSPSVGGNTLRLESHLLDYQGPELYGETLEVHLLRKLRNEQRFDSLEALRQQIARDIEAVRAGQPDNDC